MLFIRNGNKVKATDDAVELQWHEGEPCPAIPANWRSIEVYADGDERHSLLARLSLRFQAGSIVPPNPANPTPSPDPVNVAFRSIEDQLFTLFREVRRWRDDGFITADSYAYFLDGWARVLVQLRAGQ